MVMTSKKFKGKGGKKRVHLATSKFSVKAGKTVKVSVKVNRAGLGLLRRSKGARSVTVKASVKDTRGNKGNSVRKMKTNRPPGGAGR